MASKSIIVSSYSMYYYLNKLMLTYYMWKIMYLLFRRSFPKLGPLALIEKRERLRNLEFMPNIIH